MMNFKGKSGILRFQLNSAYDGGIKISDHQSAHMGIKLHPTLNPSVVQFPVPKGIKGNIVDENKDEVVVEFNWSDTLKSLYSYQTIRVVIKKPYLGSLMDIVL